MLFLIYGVAPEFLLLPIIAIPFIIWALAKKAKALNAQGPRFNHIAKRNWCYVLIAAFVLTEIGMIQSFFYFAGDLSRYPQQLQLGIHNSSYIFLIFFAWIHTLLLWGVALGPLLIWWNVVSKKELSAEQPDDYKQRSRRCNIRIIIGVAWYVLGLVSAAFLAWTYFALTYH